MAEIILDRLSKRYGKKHGPFAVKDLSLSIRDKEFMVFLGPSGCGKTTTLRMIAGLEEITGGNLTFDGKHINDLPPQARDLAMAFENYALYPTLAVQDNIEFPMKVRRWPQSRIDEKIEWVAKAVQITDILQRESLELDTVFECCGQQSALDQAVKLCKPMGRVIIVGIPETDQISFAVHDARRKGLTFINVRRQNKCVDPVIDLIREGRINPDFMITHRFSLNRAAGAFELLADYRDGIIKAMVDIG